jgi:hypothetical protein
MLKKITIIALSIFTAFTAHADIFRVNKDYTYNLYYNGQSLTLQGYYFPKQVLLAPRKDLHQVSNKSIVNSMRNFFTAYQQHEKQWLKEHSTGPKKFFEQNYQYYTQLFFKDLAHIKGYAMYNNYIIIFLYKKETKQKMIFIIEKDQDEYKIALDFKALHPNQYKIIEESYKGYGDFIVNKGKI